MQNNLVVSVHRFPLKGLSCQCFSCKMYQIRCLMSVFWRLCPFSLSLFRKASWADWHFNRGTHRGQSGLALRWEDALHRCTYWSDGLCAPGPGAGHRSSSLLRSGSGTAFSSYLLLPAGRSVLHHPADHLPAVHLLYHGAEVSPGSWRSDEAGCR